MNRSASEIMKFFDDVVRDVKILSSKDIEEKYSTFKSDLESIYNMAINSVINNTVQASRTRLDMMLQAREGLISGRTSKLTTDMFVGNQLGKTYIYPKVEMPSQADFKRAIKKLEKKEAEGNGE